MLEPGTTEPLVGNIRIVARTVGTSTSTIRRRIRDGDFPRPFRLHPRGMLLWKLEELRDYLDHKAVERAAA